MPRHYSIGVDFGTGSVRSLLVDLADGRECVQESWNYRHGKNGVMTDPKNPLLARQHPQDYMDGLLFTLSGVVRKAKKSIKGFSSDQVIGMGVDTTGSTPIPVDAQGLPLGLHKKFQSNLNAMAWLWKDHSGQEQALEITEKIKKQGLPYLNQCGGTYSSEWYWSKILHCLRVDTAVFQAAASWVELCDFIPAYLTGASGRSYTQIKRGICAAGHKALYSEEWGWPSENFLRTLDSRLVKVLKSLPDKTYAVGQSTGTLAPAIARKVGLSPRTAVSIGAFDAHLGAVGSGVGTGKFVKIIGTSTCDITVSPATGKKPFIKGVCGVVTGSVIPCYWGIEAGQSAVGDIFNWYTSHLSTENKSSGHALAQTEKHIRELTSQAALLKVGQSGLLALDWHNGNRTVLVDPKLTGLMLGQTLHTTAAEEFRTLVEATAFGARMIIERIEEYRIKIKEVIACGGIAEKNPFVMQIYANIFNRPIRLPRASQTCAFGSAMAGAVAAGAFASFEQAGSKLVGYKTMVYRPQKQAVQTYEKLFKLYRDLHDSFGIKSTKQDISQVMKELLIIKQQAMR